MNVKFNSTGGIFGENEREPLVRALRSGCCEGARFAHRHQQYMSQQLAPFMRFAHSVVFNHLITMGFEKHHFYRRLLVSKKKKCRSGSGDPRKRAAAKAAEFERQRESELNSILDELLTPEIVEKANSLAENFLQERVVITAEDEKAAVQRFFLMLSGCVNAMRIAGIECSVNFEKMAARTGLTQTMRAEIEVWLADNGLIHIDNG